MGKCLWLSLRLQFKRDKRAIICIRRYTHICIYLHLYRYRYRYPSCSRAGQSPLWMIDYSLRDKEDREWKWPRSGKSIDEADKLPAGTLGALNEPRRQVLACMLC